MLSPSEIFLVLILGPEIKHDSREFYEQPQLGCFRGLRYEHSTILVNFALAEKVT